METASLLIRKRIYNTNMTQKKSQREGSMMLFKEISIKLVGMSWDLRKAGLINMATPDASKNDACFKIGEKRLKNNQRTLLV